MKRALFLLFIVVLSLLRDPARGCGPDFQSEQYRFWLLQPQLAEARSLHPFYFTTDVLYATDDAELVQIGYDLNVAEWQRTVGNSVPQEAIAAILYGTDPADFWGNEDSLFATNAFLKRLAQMKGGWPEYIRFAKTCEQLMAYTDPWEFDEHDRAGMQEYWSTGKALLKKARDPVLRARITYQLVRMAHYGGLPLADAQAVYDKYLMPLRGKTWLEPSAAFYLASMQDNPARDLAYADLLDRALDKRSRMVQLFASGEVDNYLPLATSDKQRASLLVMRDLQHPGRALDDLERIAAYDPGNTHLPLLLTREVNKLEDWLLTPQLTEFSPAIRQWDGSEDGVPPEEVVRIDLDYLLQVKDFIVRILPQASPDQRPLLNLLDGHLSFVAGDFTGCMARMQQVERDDAAKPLVRMQAALDRVLCGIMATDHLTDATRNDILALVQEVNTSEPLAPYRTTLLDQLHLYLGKKLIARGELPEGAFLLARTDRLYGTTMGWWSANARQLVFEQAVPTDYDRMIALLDKPDKSPFERYLTGTNESPEGWEHTENRVAQTELTRNKLLDYKATWYLREDSLEAAAATFRQIPDTFWTGFPYAMFYDDDPFLVNIEDPNNYRKTDHAHYNKRTIVERMIALRKEAARDPKKRALNNYLLGNAYYSMSDFGKYWILSRIQWGIWDRSDWRDDVVPDAPGDEDYFGCRRAAEHYQAALENATDPVLKAMACRMAWECELNWTAYTGESADDMTNPYEEQLTDTKSQEAYAAIQDCSGYADFVGRYR